MFIYSMRASTIKFFGIVCVSLALLITLIAFVPTYAVDNSEKTGVSVSYNYEKVKSNEDRINFLKQFGWEVDGTPVAEKEVVIPEEFDKIFVSYNEIQRKQGLDLSDFRKKSVMRYTYQITNYPDYDGKVYANILIYRGNVIGGDICSADLNGFVHGFEKASE